MLEELYYDLDLEFSFWEYDDERPYYDEDSRDIESYKLQKLGYSGITINNYSQEEYEKIYDFCSKNNNVIVKESDFTDTLDTVLGPCTYHFMNVRTKNPKELIEFLNNLPARTKVSKTKPSGNLKNVVKFKGENITLYMYETEFKHNVKYFNDFLKLARKISK